MRYLLLFLCFFMLITSCKEQPQHTPEIYSKKATTFKIWAPTATKVQVHLYKNGHDGTPYETHLLASSVNGKWSRRLENSCSWR